MTTRPPTVSKLTHPGSVAGYVIVVAVAVYVSLHHGSPAAADTLSGIVAAFAPVAAIGAHQARKRPKRVTHRATGPVRHLGTVAKSKRKS